MGLVVLVPFKYELSVAKKIKMAVMYCRRFLKAVPIGDEILIRANTDKMGGKIVFLSVDIINKANGALIAKGSHTKFIGG